MVAAIYDLPVDIQCCMCRHWYTVIVNRHDLNDWLSGSRPIQDALDYLSPSEREILLSQTCGDCFNELFPPLDSDD